MYNEVAFDLIKVRLAYLVANVVMAVMVLLSGRSELIWLSIVTAFVLWITCSDMMDNYPRARVYTMCAWNDIVVLVTSFYFGFECGFFLNIFAQVPVSIFYGYVYFASSGKKFKGWITWVLAIASLYISLIIGRTHVPVVGFTKDVSVAVFMVNSTACLSFIIFVCVSIRNELIHVQEKNMDKAALDLLTGLRTRRLFDAEFNDRGLKTSEICAAIMDIDDFKKFNDNYGHNAGDKVLQTISDIIMEIEIRNSSFMACRWGGEEFVIIAPIESYDILKHELEVMIKNLKLTDIEIGGTRHRVTITAGLACPGKGSRNSLEDLIGRADALLYQGKKAGKDRLVEDTERGR
ncbi:GGDEF domain-containing protein [Butyrivibrio sp. MC2013]|uniref:GGDEF domain-containing protein n=1 Tax=Butyrivibrio sp. MC2013 TaxID=1280686 RepID=UPI0003FC7502|nr:GGDEF domain-containing protein [Butyrivibrio sp. MC2013]